MLRLSSNRFVQRALVLRQQPSISSSQQRALIHHVLMVSKHRSKTLSLVPSLTSSSRLGAIRTAVNGVVAKSLNGSSSSPSKVNGIKRHNKISNHESALSSASIGEDPERRKIVKSLLKTLQYAASLDGSQHDHDDDDEVEERWEIELVYVDDDDEDDDEHEQEPSRAVNPLPSSSSPAVLDAGTPPTDTSQPPRFRPSASSWSRQSLKRAANTATTETDKATTTATNTKSPAPAPAAASRFNHDSAGWVRLESTQFHKDTNYTKYQAKKMQRRQLQKESKQQPQPQPPPQYARQRLEQQEQQAWQHQHEQQQQELQQHQQQQQQQEVRPHQEQRRLKQRPRSSHYSQPIPPTTHLPTSNRRPRAERAEDVVLRSIRNDRLLASSAASPVVYPEASELDSGFFMSHQAPPLIKDPTADFGVHNHEEYYLPPAKSFETSERPLTPPQHNQQQQQQHDQQQQQQYDPQQQYQLQQQLYQSRKQQQQQRPMAHEEQVPSQRLHSERMRQQQQQQQGQPDQAPSAIFDTSKWSMSTKADRVKDETAKLQERLLNAIRLHEIDRAMSIFDDSRSRRMVLEEHVAKSLFYFLVETQPIFAYQVLKYVRFHYYNDKTRGKATTKTTSATTTAHASTTEGHMLSDEAATADATTVATTEEPQRFPVDMYRRVCRSVRLLDPVRVLHRHIRGTLSPLIEDIRLLPLEEQKLCMPFLVASLVEQRGVDMGRQSQVLYQHMIDHQFDLSERYFEHLLLKSKYTRQDDLPFHDVLRQLISRGGQPPPGIVLHVLQNLFPFTDTEATTSVLRSILELQKRKQQPKAPSEEAQVEPTEKEEPKPELTFADPEEDIDDVVTDDEPEKKTKKESRKAAPKPRVHDDFVVDMGMLHHIASAAARSGKHDVILLLWDILDMMGVEPTEAIYECTVHSFVKGYHQDLNVFAVLSEMEAKGFPPSRALTRTISLSLRYSQGRIDNAYRLITEKPDGKVSFASLNAIMSSCAELDDAEMTFATLNDFAKFDLKPNSDTLSYALEAIGNEMEKEANKTPGRVRHYVAITGAVLNMAEELGVTPCHHFIHEYARILCRAGELDTARQVLLQILEQPDGQLLGRTVNMVAVENAKAGKYDDARSLLAASNEPTPLAMKRIEFMEKGLEDPVKTTRYGFQTDENTDTKHSAEDHVNEVTAEGGLPHWRIRADPTKTRGDPSTALE